ncbi:MAG: hypothetical protein ABR860_00870 [Terracidiphilus sp.]|jgi:hypothetical protein
MKTARFFAMAILAAASIPLMAQEAGADGSQKAVYAPQGPMGFGDEAASHSWEMSSVTGELEDRLNSATARVGDRVVLKTTEKVITADGTVIPRGTRLVGHITQVQARDATHSVAQLAIAIDHAELKNGQSIAIFTLIRGVNPSAGVMGMNPMNRDGPMTGMDAYTGGGATTGGVGGGRGGRSGGEQSGTLGDAVQGTPATTTSVGDRAGANPDPNPQGAVELAGHGDLNENVGAHQAAAARAIPHPTAIPGVMLAGNSSASGVFSATMKDIQFENGTQMQLGIVADR